MGLFGSIGRALGGAIKGVAKVGSFALKSGLVPLPFGGTAGRLVGGLLQAKAPTGHSQLKLQIPPLVLRGKTVRPTVAIGATRLPTITALRKTPTMPGGSVATPRGIAPRPLSGAAPLGVTAGAGGTTPRKRKRRKSAGASTRRRSRSASARKRTRRRKLKFGSPAWRKKYLGHGKRRKRRAA